MYFKSDFPPLLQFDAWPMLLIPSLKMAQNRTF